MKRFLITCLVCLPVISFSQSTMSPELLWHLGRLAPIGLSKDKQYVLYSVSTPDISANKMNTKSYRIPVAGGVAEEINRTDTMMENIHVSPNGKWKISDSDVKLMNVYGNDFYPALPKSNVQIYNSLMYRHWDTWEDGKFSHVFLNAVNDTVRKDLMAGEPYDCPLKPFGNGADYIWNPDGKHVVYVTKKKSGTEYTLSTNTDLYEYDIESGATKNLTEGMMGYDVSPSFNKKGDLAWLSMKRDGYEADKQDIVVSNGVSKINLTASRDDIHVEAFRWSDDDKNIFFVAPKDGTLQLFQVNYPGATKIGPVVTQITKGDYDVAAIVGQSGNSLIVTRTDMNHAAEIYSVDLDNGSMKKLTSVNDSTYNALALCKTERRYVTTTDNKQMLVWVIFPPNFDPSKKYPTLLYCQGGPQSPLTQFYSFRWNFQLIASQGYIIVAPDRRGMPGFGTQWNEQVSKDWGGQVLRDYLSAIDAVSKEKYVDTSRRGCVGASFGGFSSFALEATHNHRFKTFIAHDGTFDFRSMYGTTDEMWFENWDKGGPYWDKSNAAAQRSFSQSPSNFVDKWDAPILIFQGGKDYRVPIEQGQQAFQAAQLRGIKSRFIYLPDENHWVLNAQDALVWQHEFFQWLEETMPAKN
ncbi:MAG TPA: prolyl oligopeptidase family serine peptidase [Parafilimonas sp.]|nr:prolyl oligopeptidase family serine peptidase [Parafilimonas sp.]